MGAVWPVCFFLLTVWAATVGSREESWNEIKQSPKDLESANEVAMKNVLKLLQSVVSKTNPKAHEVQVETNEVEAVIHINQPVRTTKGHVVAEGAPQSMNATTGTFGSMTNSDMGNSSFSDFSTNILGNLTLNADKSNVTEGEVLNDQSSNHNHKLSDGPNANANQTATNADMGNLTNTIRTKTKSYGLQNQNATLSDEQSSMSQIANLTAADNPSNVTVEDRNAVMDIVNKTFAVADMGNQTNDVLSDWPLYFRGANYSASIVVHGKVKPSDTAIGHLVEMVNITLIDLDLGNHTHSDTPSGNLTASPGNLPVADWSAANGSAESTQLHSDGASNQNHTAKNTSNDFFHSATLPFFKTVTDKNDGNKGNSTALQADMSNKTLSHNPEKLSPNANTSLADAPNVTMEITGRSVDIIVTLNLTAIKADMGNVTNSDWLNNTANDGHSNFLILNHTVSNKPPKSVVVLDLPNESSPTINKSPSLNNTLSDSAIANQTGQEAQNDNATLTDRHSMAVGANGTGVNADMSNVTVTLNDETPRQNSTVGDEPTNAVSNANMTADAPVGNGTHADWSKASKNVTSINSDLGNTTNGEALNDKSFNQNHTLSDNPTEVAANGNLTASLCEFKNATDLRMGKSANYHC